jgi:hypothetical protein
MERTECTRSPAKRRAQYRRMAPPSWPRVCCRSAWVPSNRNSLLGFAFGLLLACGLAGCGASETREPLNAPTAVAAKPTASPQSPLIGTRAPTATPAATAPAASTVLPEPPTASRAAGPAGSPTSVRAPATPRPSVPAQPAGWQSYHGDRAGFATSYPPDWVVDEQIAASARVVVFAPSAGAEGITVRVRAGEIDAGQPVDPRASGRCQRIAIGGQNGTRCLDLVWFRVAGRQPNAGKLFTITAAQSVDHDIYERFLASFTIISP